MTNMEIDTTQLNEKELDKIREIVSTSEKRPRKKVFTIQWVYHYMDEGFKGFSYSNFDEVLDMMDSLFDIGLSVGLSITKLKSDIKYHFVEEEYNNYIDMENVLQDKESRRLRKLLYKWGIKEKDILIKEEDSQEE